MTVIIKIKYKLNILLQHYYKVGKLTDDFYFTYEVRSSVAGFGLGEESTIYISRKKELLLNYGFTSKQMYLIDENIHKRFFYRENSNEIDI